MISPKDEHKQLIVYPCVYQQKKERRYLTECNNIFVEQINLNIQLLLIISCDILNFKIYFRYSVKCVHSLFCWQR